MRCISVMSIRISFAIPIVLTVPYGDFRILFAFSIIRAIRFGVGQRHAAQRERWEVEWWVVGDEIAVSSYNDHRVQVFDLIGRLRRTIGGPDVLKYPMGVVYHRQNAELFVGEWRRR